MKSQVTLLLICMLFSKALSLTCHQCLPSASGKCTEEQTTCSDQCLTSTTAVYMSGIKLTDLNVKTCGMPELCATGSMNIGTAKVTSNTKCCSTNLCNSETLPVQQGINTLSVKGCVSKSFCVGSGSSSIPGIGISHVQCCEGNLCNSAKSVTLSFLLMIVPLLSSILFY
ncbi:lymphocyte antigen 6B-like isoform X2 [Neoarius graeffei]|uniref:lymphocyte antigen 6B-like isoform X2 n=1 Tax=Neoarius graeffei TaxID=443677 RepID=UPI00298D0A2D|nr:lymphocyte antigen 6B-like isoform X2 [Neoarius graeffei]